jgi:hypothetical protein
MEYRMNRLWIATVVLVSSLIAEVGALASWDVKREGDREVARKVEQAERDKSAAAQHEEDRLRSEPHLVSFAKTRHECSAVNSEVTCHLTNFEKTPIVTCMQGVLVQKEAAGVRLYSMPMCSGAIPPMTTMSVTAPWDAGRATDICKSSSSNFLDWEKCNFSVIDYEKKAE